MLRHDPYCVHLLNCRSTNPKHRLWYEIWITKSRGKQADEYVRTIIQPVEKSEVGEDLISNSQILHCFPLESWLFQQPDKLCDAYFSYLHHPVTKSTIIGNRAGYWLEKGSNLCKALSKKSSAKICTEVVEDLGGDRLCPDIGQSVEMISSPLWELDRDRRCISSK